MVLVWVSGLLSTILYVTALTIPDWGRDFTRFGVVYTGLVLAYVGFVAGLVRIVSWGGQSGTPSSRLLAGVFTGAVVFRLLGLLAPPSLSDDLYRYLWDGRLLLEGIPPYRFAPLDPALAPYRDALWGSINNPHLPTIYPPLLLLVFAAVAWISPTVGFWKVVATGFDLGAGLFLALALRRLGRSPAWAGVYLWHPLVVLEISGNGHADAVGWFLVSIAFWAWAGRPGLGTGVALTLAGLVKFLPWVVLPRLIPALRVRWLLLPILAGLIYLPFLLGEGGGVGSLGVFARKWQSNDFLFGFLIREEPPSDAALVTARRVAGGVFALVWLTVLLARRPLVSTYAWMLAALLLLSPVVHPWYVLWLLPAVVLGRCPAWWLWSLTVVLAYHPLPEFREQGIWVESMFLKGLEYLPVLVLIPWQLWLELKRSQSVKGTPGAVSTGKGNSEPPEIV